MFTLDNLIEATDGKILSEGERLFNSASIDTRTIRQDELFFPLKGSRFDGHDFLEEALEKAAGAVISKDIHINFKGKTVIKVKDTLQALQSLAKHLRSNFKGEVLAIVGSNGKTTTKELAAAFLSEKFRILKTEGNLNNNIGVPLCLSKINYDTNMMVLELGTNKRGDIKELCEIVQPNYALVTNIGYEHIEGFGSLEGVRNEELEILPYVHTVFANGDDKFLMEGLKNFKGSLITFGFSENCDYRAYDLDSKEDYAEFTISKNSVSFKIKSNLLGFHNIQNLLAASTVAIYFGVPDEIIKKTAERFNPVKLRFERFKIKNFEIILDAYNANPSSMRVALEELARMSHGKKTIALLGDMFELGEYTEKAHEDIGKWIKELGIDLFIGVGNSVKNALRYVDGELFTNPKEAAEFLIKTIKEPSVVLIKGSRAMKMEEAFEVLKERTI